MKRVVSVMGTLGLLAGCASAPDQSPWLISRSEPIPMACAPLSQDQELTLNLAQKTAEEGRLHAALANLERLPESLPQARLQKARLLRSLNRAQARDLYASLVDTCLKAQGEHGLGQLASAAGHNEQALPHLRLAASLDPTSATIRNDLGVVYMNLGRLDEARFELLTSMELNESEKQPALNLLTLLIYQDNLQQASALVDRMRLTPSQFRAAEQRAQALRRSLGGVATGSALRGPATGAVQPAAQTPAAVALPEVRPAAPVDNVPSVPVAVPVKPSAAAPSVVARPVASAAKVIPAKPVSQPADARSVPAVVTRAVAPAATPPARPVPAPQLSNFRPVPVIPQAVAAVAASRSSASLNQPSPAATAAAPANPAVAATPAPAPRSRPSVRVLVETIATAPKTPVRRESLLQSAPAPVRRESLLQSAPPPTDREGLLQSAQALPPAPTQAPAVATRAHIELRPGRLIVADDGSIRIEPSDSQGAIN